MPKVNKTVVEKALRDMIFEMLINDTAKENGFVRINDRQYGILVNDENGDQRYIRIGAIVAELREDMTAEQLMESEIATYNRKQAEKIEKAQTRAEKARKDKAKREKEKSEG